jgi:2,3-bisphosphoglycerate-dependent phosphoglycerate mutase
MDLLRETANSDVDDNDNHDDPILVVAHANTLRALVMHLDDISPSEIEDVNIGTALPFYYDVDKTTGHVVSASSSPPSTFRGIYIDDERKRRNFLERRRAANDPWLWALHDDQVSPSMLLVNGGTTAGACDTDVGDSAAALEGTEGLEDEARHNTEVFAASALKPAGSQQQRASSPVRKI